MLKSLITPFIAVESDTPDELPGINYWIEDGNNEVVLEVVTTTHDNDDYGEQIAAALNKIASMTKALQEIANSEHWNSGGEWMATEDEERHPWEIAEQAL